MDLAFAIQRLTTQAETIRTLASDVSDLQARFEPAPGSWSMLVVINHLYDEERLDFRARLDSVLHHPGAEWPAIDPAAWVTSHDYAARSLPDSLESFLAERRQSLAWLGGLSAPDLGRYELAPWGSPLYAGDLLSAWLAHDLLHIRQLAELHYTWTARIALPYGLHYAGEW